MATVQPPTTETLAVQTLVPRLRENTTGRELVTYLAVGVLFGVVLVKSQVVSWYRIQEMFRFQSFHMYGVLGSAMLTALIFVQILQRMEAFALSGERISVPRRRSAQATATGLAG
jgi:uncharacterized protein